jgi:cyclic pyranopterin phosphate synthase
MSLFDPCGKKINYLRLSITDRCNLRCCYCMPACGVDLVERADLLSYEELLRVSRAAVDCGVEKIRVTGGEPLVRKGVVGFLARLNALPGLKRVVVTTNGVLLDEMAAELKGAGVESLNVSLDSMRPEIFNRITRCGDLGRVLRGIEAAERAGFQHLKLNMVVMRGVNDGEVEEFAAMTLDKPFRVRFIEFMPTLRNMTASLTVPGEELLSRLSRRFELEPVTRDVLDGPAEYHRIKGACGSIGFINPMSCHFCADCNRIRITSNGVVKSCLFKEAGLDLKPLLKYGEGSDLREALHGIVKTKVHWRGASGHGAFAMSQVGG